MSQMRSLRLVTVVGFAALLTVIFLGSVTRVANAQQFPPPGAGYLDYNYGTDVNGAGRTPTESKPESKLWWNDGFWWAGMWNPTAAYYHIYRLNWGTQVWEDTGVQLDDRVLINNVPSDDPNRKDRRMDTLWDATNKKLYVATHFAQLNPGDTNNKANYARLYRYSYNDATRSYSLDTGFPVNINHDKTEALVLAKDATGRLWVTYVSRVAAETPVKYRVYVNASTGSDTSWDPEGTFDLTTLSNITDTARVSKDDISAIVSFKDNTGDKVGILWSNQFSTTKTSLNFAWHAAGASNFKTNWTLQPTLNNLGGTPIQSKANDHMNVKSLTVNNTGQVFAAIKFENQVFVPDQPTFPEIGLLARDVDGTFVYRKYSTVADNDSRPLLLIDEADTANNNDNVANLFVSGLPQGSKICYKTLALKAPPAALSTLGQFPSGNCGTGFIVDASGVYTTFRDPTSTKQNVNNTTGIVVLASDVNGRTYAHNAIGNPPPVVTAYGPSGAAPVVVTGVVTATFSKPISSTTLTNLSFQVTDGVTAVPGTVSYHPNSRTATFTPSSPLKANTTYTVKLTNDIKDTTNLRLDAFKSTTPNTVVEQWTFNTGLTTVQFELASSSALENAGNAVISVTLASPASQAVTVNYATSDGTATAGSDYTASSGTVTFNPGETVQPISVPILEDNLTEGNETINLTLSNPAGANAGVPMTSTLTIIDNEGPPSVQFEQTSYAVNENAGTVTVNVILSHPSLTGFTVDYTTGDGSATAGQDYATTSGTLTFAANDGTPKTIVVPITADNIAELDESFNLTLSNPTGGAVLGTPNDKSTVTIHDTTSALTVQFDAAPYTVDEAVGTTNVTVKLSGPSATTVTVDYAINGGTAKAGEDYTVANSTGTLTFAPNETTQTIPVTVIDDGLDEDNETIDLALSNPTGGLGLGDPAQTTLTINDNDAEPTVQFNPTDYTAVENDGKVTLTVQLSTASGRAIQVPYISSDGTAVDGTDYVGVDDNLIILAGETSATFDVTLLNDTAAEQTETATVKLNAPLNATLGANTTANLTILDDDAAPVVPTVQFSGATYSVNEGTGTATITVTLSAATTAKVSVNYTTGDGTATVGQDYTKASGVLNFAAGQTKQTFTVSIANDAAHESDETINLTLTGPTNATLSTTQATAVLTIVDNDPTATGSKSYLPFIKRQ